MSLNVGRYRKKPVVIEAVLYTDPLADVFAIAEWCGGEVMYEGTDPVIVVHTLEGDMTARLGWAVIKGVQGEFYPCAPDIFAATYDPTTDQAVQPPEAPRYDDPPDSAYVSGR